jgi:16S rRNA (guanine966-N2)-methyltransferase
MRIIAGELKARKLKTPTWEGLRPTSDRLRETLFNVLATRVPGARVLDAYAGTGAIGIEALSRGAAHVTFMDSDPRAVNLIGENLRRCGVSDRYAIIRSRFVSRPVDKLRVVPSEVEGRQARDHQRRRRVGLPAVALGPEAGETPQALPTGSFDLAVLDPPYDELDLTAVLAAAVPLIAPGGLLVLEHARRRPAPASVGGLDLTRDLISGDSALAFYRRSVRP